MSFSKGLRSKETGEVLHNYLRILGYREDKHVKVLGNPNVFEHPHQREFILVMRFLLGLLDESEAESTFRHCYPPLDKKHEAEFRSKAFKWYKSLQANNPELLVPITSSLFLSPGGPKFMHFLMSFISWVSLQIIRRQSPEEEILSPAFITSPDLPASSKVRYLKSKANEFQRTGFQVKGEAEELLNKGKELVTDLELKYRKDKASIDAMTAEEMSHTLEDLLQQRIELEEKVSCVGVQMNQMLKQLEEDLNTIHSIQGKKSEALNVSHCLYNKTSLKEYINEVTKELSSIHESVNTDGSAKGILTLSEITSDLLPKVNRFSQKLTDSLLNLNQGIIPKSSEEVNEILESLRKVVRPLEEPDKCLLPPTPIVDIMAARNETLCNSLLNTTSSPSLRSREHSDTPRGRNTTRSFSKKNSPIISLKPIETQSFNHLEDSGSDLRCISTFSPVLSSSRMLSSMETRESSPTLGSSMEQSSKSDFSNKASAVLERYRNMKLLESEQDRGGKVISSTTEDQSPPDERNKKTPLYFEPIRLRSSLSLYKPLKEDINSPPLTSCGDASPFFDPKVNLVVDKSSLETESKRISKLDDLIEELSQDMSLNSLDKQVDPFSLKRKSMNGNEEDDDEIPLPPFHTFRFNQVNRRNSLLNSEAFIGSRLESLIETLGGNEDIHSLTDKFELPNFDL